MANNTLIEAERSLEAVAANLFSGRYPPSEVGPPLIEMHSAVLRAADDESLPQDTRRLLLISFNIFRMTAAFLEGDQNLVEKHRSDAIRFYQRSIEIDENLPLIWWFIGVLRHKKVDRFVSILKSNSNALKPNKNIAHSLIATCLEAIRCRQAP
jgi:hypothetical protein